MDEDDYPTTRPRRVRLGGDLYRPVVPPGAVARCHGDELIRLVLEVSR